jgi:predicted O-linked N-acetylglucosamine transferase (SPINDLY family)
MGNHNCDTCTNTNTDTCKKVHPKKAAVEQTYGFYSRVLNKPFDSVAELQAAEDAYYEEIRAKEAMVDTKAADTRKVEEAFKALNAARKTYRENLEQLTDEYSEALANLKKVFETGRADQRSILVEAETNYSNALKEFTAKYPNFTITLTDGDTKTTISNHAKASGAKKSDTALLNLFDLLFNF